MKSNSFLQFSSLYLRIAIAFAYLWAVADRLGMLGQPGQPHVSWGDWSHFLSYCYQIMSFLPHGFVAPLAIAASIGEALFGILLIIGLFTRLAAIGSGLLSLCFAVSMAISFGIDSPLSYSVFTLSAASFLLSGMPFYAYSLDARRTLKKSSINKLI